MASGPRRVVPGRTVPRVVTRPTGVVTGGPVVAQPAPGLLRLSHTGSLFSTGRPGQAVVRAEDLLALRFEFRNLAVEPGPPPVLRHAGSGAAFIVVHFPPQAVTEETFFETRPAGTQNPESSAATKNPHPQTKPKPDGPAGGDPLRPPPIRARIAGESRLAFRVPAGFQAPYTLAGVLEACRTLPLAVANNAGPRARVRRPIKVGTLFQVATLKTLKPWQRTALAVTTLRTLRLAATPEQAPTLAMRQSGASAALRPVPGGLLGRVPGLSVVRRPGPPGATTTAVEFPWRLILSPHGEARWHHASGPQTAPETGHTELWHTRLAVPDETGRAIESGNPDPDRTLRAIWALTGEGSGKEMVQTWPQPADLPDPNTSPFRMPLDDFDRFQITHLSSNFTGPGYVPEPVEADALMLSALGGWLDSRGAWEPPGLSVEEWVHRASMARDHYVKVVYRGFLFPFGHRVSLVKVSERKFHSGARDDDGNPTIEQAPGNAAYLRQRLFIVTRERERAFDEPALQAARNTAGTVVYGRQFPFPTVRLVTQVTPNLDRPDTLPSSVDGLGQRMFWPHVDGQPFRFQWVATDLDGNRIGFDLPMIFVDNTLACPRTWDAGDDKLKPAWGVAEPMAAKARDAYAAGGDRRVASLRRQKVALAPSLKPGDTAVDVETMTFGGEAEAGNQTLRTASNDLQRPVWFPKVAETQARIGAVSHLTGSDKGNRLVWNAHYLQKGYGQNVGEVFADIAGGEGKLDFSAQGDRSGGFVQPNLKPVALSRLSGPVTGNAADHIAGAVPKGAGFPSASLSDLPLPLLFGCIPLAEVIAAVANIADNPERVPKFVSEAATALETFVTALARLHGLVTTLASDPAQIGQAALSAFSATLADQIAQGAAYAAAQMQPVEAAVAALQAAMQDVAAKLAAFDGLDVNAPALPAALAALPGSAATARARVADLKAAANASVGGVSLPSGLRQSILSAAKKLDDLLAALETLPPLVTAGRALFDALDAVVGDPSALGDLLQDGPTLTARLQAVADAAGDLRTALAGADILDGAPRKSVLDALGAVEEVLGSGVLAQIVEFLTGDEFTVRFDWRPEISSWWFPGVNPATDDPIFRANDRHGFIVAVEAKVKRNGSSSPKIGVVCGLRHFDLVLIAPASFMELNFEKIEFSIDSGAKPNVDVLLTDIKFVGPLSFVETLRDLIPLDGFSDPPYLDITPQGIDAGFDIALPSITCGVLNIANISLGAGFTVPFIGQPVSVRFNFCTREQPFSLTVWMFGGGGFFGVTVDPHGVQILEASFEFGASISIDLGVASGGVHVMAGIYFRMEQDAASLTGYFRLGGHVDVLGLITASLELYLELRYEFQTGKCVGKAQLTIEITVFVFSGSVTITCERKFAGANGDPSLRQMLGHRPDLPLDQELALIDGDTDYAWRDYCEAFA